MPSRKIPPEERAAVVEFLKRWHDTMLGIQDATGRMSLVAADKTLGVNSEAYERARVGAMAVVHQAGLDSVEVGYWPVVSGRKGPALMAALSGQMYDVLKCQLDILRLWGQVTEAFRRGREKDAPSIEEFISLQTLLANLMDEMGNFATGLALHYKIPASELESPVIEASEKPGT